MGLSIDSTKFLVQAWNSGVRFDHVLTLGRQYMMVSPRRLEAILRQYGCWPPPGGAGEFYRALAGSAWRFAVFARALGAKEVSACDVSAYEGADLIHDLNLPVPAGWEEKYDLVLDGGALEHVFNFPVAIANCMRMVKTGGHLILLTPANNYFGHGFYQFSPELFYRVLSRENGFEVVRMIGLEDGLGRSSLLGVKYNFYIKGPWFEVRDPAEVRKCVTLVNHNPVCLFVLAKKVSREDLFKTPPQQSHYVAQWEACKGADPFGQSSFGRRVVAWLRSHLSEEFYRESLPRLALALDPCRLWRFRHNQSFSNREFYRKVGS